MPVSVFSLFLNFAEKEYQTGSKRSENLRWFFMDQKKPLKQKSWARRVLSPLWGWRARPGGRVRPLPCGPLVTPWPRSSSYIFTYIPKPPEASRKTLFHHCNLPFPWDPILGAFPAPCRRGIRSRRASTSTLLPFRWSVSSLPQTYGSIASS